MGNWIEACNVDDVEVEDVIGVEINGSAVAIYRCPDGNFFATDGLCTHEQVSLADGLVMGHIIECPKHNGRFDYRTGDGRGAPISVSLRTYPVKVDANAVFVEID